MFLRSLPYSCQIPKDRFRIRNLTLPDDSHLPAGPTKQCDVPPIPSNCLIEFFLPELRIRRRHCRAPAPAVAMPETAMHQYNQFIFGQDNIGTSRKVSTMKAKPVPCGVQDGPNYPLGRGIASLYPGHVPTSFRFGKPIHCDYPFDAGLPRVSISYTANANAYRPLGNLTCGHQAGSSPRSAVVRSKNRVTRSSGTSEASPPVKIP